MPAQGTQHLGGTEENSKGLFTNGGKGVKETKRNERSLSFPVLCSPALFQNPVPKSVIQNLGSFFLKKSLKIYPALQKLALPQVKDGESTSWDPSVPS